jgi:hypothetical protein
MTTFGVASYPLYWPLQHPRTQYRRAARFAMDFTTARGELLRELGLLGAKDYILSTNIPIRRDGLPMVPDREPADPGVAVYFARKGKPFVIGCDQFSRVRWNLRAVGATIEALRAIERHGTTSMMEQAFSGFAFLPEAARPRGWREVLSVSPIGPVDPDVVRARYRELARKLHPDVAGGDGAAMAEVNVAYGAALAELEPKGTVTKLEAEVEDGSAAT